MDKGTTSNVISACSLGACLAMPESLPGAFYSASIFAFSGGITNWLAVKMLFDRIPGLIGSGVIPARFREIRSQVKSLILEHFFDQRHLEEYVCENADRFEWSRYLKSDTGGGGPFAAVVELQWKRLTAPDVVQPIIDSQLAKLMQSPAAGMVALVGVEKLRPTVNQFVTSFIASMQHKVVEFAANLEPDSIPLSIDEEKLIADVREQVDELLQKKLEQLHAADVKKMMEDVIRNHLGWLIVWGNVFGALLGLVAYLLRGYVSH